MIDVSIVTKTSQEANWNGQAGRQTGGQDHVLSQADALIIIWGSKKFWVPKNARKKLGSMKFLVQNSFWVQ